MNTIAGILVIAWIAIATRKYGVGMALHMGSSAYRNSRKYALRRRHRGREERFGRVACLLRPATPSSLSGLSNHRGGRVRGRSRLRHGNGGIETAGSTPSHRRRRPIRTDRSEGLEFARGPRRNRGPAMRSWLSSTRTRCRRPSGLPGSLPLWSTRGVTRSRVTAGSSRPTTG